MTIFVKYDKADSRHLQAYSLMKKHCGFYEITDEAGSCDVTVQLKTDASLPVESYDIRKIADNAFTISSADKLGLTHGVGRFLHRGPQLLTSQRCVPKKAVRCIYTTTHFFNFYHTAPLEEIESYLEEWAMWGCNYIQAWFDMHHFNGVDDPQAQSFLKRIHDIFVIAKNLGMKVILADPANVYYKGAPKELLATNAIENNGYFELPRGYYYTELCPSVPEGLQRLRTSHIEMWEYFSDIGLDVIGFGPYDQGGCTCPKCRPWGINGYPRLAKILAKDAKKTCPDATLIYGTWRFDDFVHGEWQGCLEQLEELSKYFTWLSVDLDSPKVPKNLYEKAEKLGLKLIVFPEISMAAVPWGGYGAAPIPKRIKTLYLARESEQIGGACYSEGIFEDLNKVIMLSLFFGNNTVDEAIEDYFRFYFTQASVAESLEFINCLDSTVERHRIEPDGHVDDYPEGLLESDELPTFRIEHPQLVERAHELAVKISEKIPKEARDSVRFQLLYLRTVMDLELKNNNWNITPVTEKIAAILDGFYHCQKNTYYCVRGLTKKSILENMGHI